MLLELF